jgi:hypothetical protein
MRQGTSVGLGQQSRTREDPLMEAGQTEEQFSNEEIAGFTRKVEEWGTGLTQRERHLLGAVLRSAAPADDEVEGYSLDGITNVVAALQLYATTANEYAMKGAADQQALLKQKQGIRTLADRVEPWKKP